VYLHDVQTRSNSLVSWSRNWPVAANGRSGTPQISADGRFVVYRSLADNLVPGDTNGAPDVFLYDRQADIMELISASAFGDRAANSRSFSPVFSGDGQMLVFQSWASDLVGQDFNQGADLFVLRLATTNPIPAFVGEIIYAPAFGPHPVLNWPATPGKSYQVQFKDNLTDPAWQPLTGSVTLVGDRGYATDLAPDPVKRFYRIVAF
jgi:hypothetical protein